jgi:tetratricopeptide (TPR) repeat protein
MKRKLLFVLVGIVTCQLIYGQPSYSEKKIRDKSMNEAIIHISEGGYELAAASLTHCLDLDSTYAPAWLLRGRIFIEWGVPDKALDEINKALYYNSGLGEAYFYKGYLLFEDDSIGEDSRLFNLAISSGYENPWAYYFRALTGIRDLMDEQAMKDLSRAIELKDDFALAYHERAGIKRRRGDLQGSHFDYQRSIAIDPDFALAYNNMGSVKILLGDYAGAIEDYTRALELKPELLIALNNRGYARFFTEDKEGALQDFNAAITSGALLSQAKLNKASLLAEQGQTVPALALMDESLQEYPDEALLYLNRGLIRELTGDLDGACEDWHRAIELGAEEAKEFIKECDP